MNGFNKEMTTNRSAITTNKFMSYLLVIIFLITHNASVANAININKLKG